MTASSPPTPAGAGAIMHGGVRTLEDALRRYRDNDLTTGDLELVLARVMRRLQDACWCDENFCCAPHGEHVAPHMRCILR